MAAYSSERVATAAEEPNVASAVCHSLAQAAAAVPRRRLGDWLPFTRWIRGYNTSMLTDDAVAGITVAVMLIPQSLSYALLAGLPPIFGMYTATVPLVVYALFAKLQVGPVATTAILVQSSVAAILEGTSGAEDPEEVKRVSVVLSLVAGLVQIGMGLFRCGFLATLLSWPVMSGFVSAAACIITVSQMKDLLGLSVDVTGSVAAKAGAVLGNLGLAHRYTAMLSVCCVMLLVFAKRTQRLPRWLPPELLLAVAATTCSWVAGWQDSMGLRVVGDVPAGLPAPALPRTSLTEMASMLPEAVVLSILSYVGSISLVVAFAQEAKEPVDADQELVALGSACVAASFFSGHAVSGSFTRTALNSEVGAKSPMAGAITGLAMIVTLSILAPFFRALPRCVLASMILVSVRKLVKVEDFRRLWTSSRSDALQFIVAFAAVLGYGLATGVVIAVGFALLSVVFSSFYYRIEELGALPPGVGVTGEPGARRFASMSRFEASAPVPGVTILRLGGVLNFGNINSLTDRLRSILDEAKRAQGAPSVLPTISEAVEDAASQSSAESGSTDVNKTSELNGGTLASLGASDAPTIADAITGLDDAVLRELPLGTTRAVVLACAGVASVDATAARALRDSRAAFAELGVPLLFAEVPGPARDTLGRFRCFSSQSVDFFDSLESAVAAAQACISGIRLA